MIDSIIAGTGNSRYLKSVANFLQKYPTYQSFAQALIAGTLPIDLNGINQDGFSVLGDPLNKATLLKDATAALFGLQNTAVPDDVLSILSKAALLVDGDLELPNGSPVPQLKIETGSYVGTGTSGESNPTQITFSKQPIFVMISGLSTQNTVGPFIAGATGVGFTIKGREAYRMYPTWGKTFSFYSTNSGETADYQMNTSGRTYNYFGIIN